LASGACSLLLQESKQSGKEHTMKKKGRMRQSYSIRQLLTKKQSSIGATAAFFCIAFTSQLFF
jgi:hypothetical protein